MDHLPSAAGWTAEVWQKPGHLLRDSAHANFRQGITTAEAGPHHAGALT